MKVRSGFVSNSSSSSFVVGFDAVPTTVEEMQAALFGGDFTALADPYHEEVYPPEMVAATVFADLQRQKKELTPRQIQNELGSGYVYYAGLPEEPEHPGYDRDQTSEERHKAYEAYRKARKLWAKQAREIVLSGVQGKHFYRFSYADEDGSYYSTLEHGGVFRRLPHVRISHH